MISLKIKSGLILMLTTLTAACGSNYSQSDTPSSITLQELESGTCVQVLFEKKNSGYAGAGYINTPNDKASRIEWGVQSPEGGQYTLEFRYANGAKEARSGDVLVNDNVNNKYSVPLPHTGGWDQWKTVSVNVDLNAGNNEIKLQAITNKGLANIDSLKVTGINPLAGNCAEQQLTTHSDAPVDYSYLNAQAVGWVTQGNGITGGGNTSPVVANTMNELRTLAAGEP